ncbi:FAD-dependent oxidoreductase [Anseongella ginsenosidimutans]|nr:FAD-dependent oxidoreductase [Anseongella ginsenosidimutans]
MNNTLKFVLNILSIVLIAILSTLPPAYAQEEYDICVYGGTSAGVIAAYTAAKMGKSVVLVVPDGHIGGLSSGGLGQTDIGNKQAIGGLSRDFYRRLGKIYGKEEAWKFEPGAAAKVFSDYLEEAAVPVIYDKRVAKVRKKKGEITSVQLHPTDGTNNRKQVISAKIYLDCTYEGDLMALAGVTYTVGREDNSIYNETLNGYQLPEYLKQSGRHQFPDGVSPYRIPGDPSSGLLYGISNATPGKTGEGDRKVQAYNFRICLTDSAENRIPVTRPPDYDSTKYELLARLFKAQPQMTGPNDYFIWSRMPNRKTDVNNRGGFSTDMIGANYNWPEASFEERKEIFEDHVSYTKGLLYFVKTDPRVPARLQEFVSQWGYPKDEYVDHGHFTPQLYIREGRRMVGEYVMTEHNCTGERLVSDPIGMAAYTMDSHNVQRIVVNGMVKNEGNVEVGKFPPYPISYGAITPKQEECTNLLVPVSLSASHIAFGSIRMEPVFMILGQSAAIAASQAINEDKAVQDINYNQLKAALLENKQVLGAKQSKQ